MNSGVAAVPDAEPEADEAEPEPTGLADDGRGMTGVGPTTMEEEEEAGVMTGEELGLDRGVRTGTETGMTGEEEGVWVLAGATVEELLSLVFCTHMYMFRWCIGLPLSAVGDGGGQQRTSDAVGLAGGGGVLRELRLFSMYTLYI